MNQENNNIESQNTNNNLNQVPVQPQMQPTQPNVNPAMQEFAQQPQVQPTQPQMQPAQPNVNPAMQEFAQQPQVQPMQPQMQPAQPQIENPIVNEFSNYAYNPQNHNIQPTQFQSQPINNISKKNNKKIFYIIGGVILTIIIAIVLIVVITKKNSNNSVSEYENDNSNVANNESSETTTNDSITYNGFSFEKISGYTYIIEEEKLYIYNGNYVIYPEIILQDFDLAKSSYKEIGSAIADYGYNVKESKIQTVSGTEMLVYLIDYDGKNMYAYYMDSTKDGYIIGGVAANSSYTFDEAILKEVVKVNKAAKYVGNYSNYSSNFSPNFELNINESED